MSMVDARTMDEIQNILGLTAASRLGLPCFAALAFRGHAKERMKEQERSFLLPTFFCSHPPRYNMCVYVCFCILVKSEMQHLFRDLTAVRRLSFQVSPKQCVLFLQLQNPACQVNTTHTHSETYD